MKYCLLFLLLASCGMEPECLGPVGQFEAVPYISLNNCLGVAHELPRYELSVDEDDEIRYCGWHNVYSQPTSYSVGCRSTITKDLHSTLVGYHGLIVVNIDCDNRSCMSVWEAEFE